jgi:predicted DCC family thiol-disulfide oxidoreductase YuxK
MVRVLFFDGHCNLCNHFIDFLIRRDRRGVLNYAPLQGKTAKVKLAPNLYMSLPSVVFLDGDEVYLRSGAALRAIAMLGGIYSLAKIFLLVPAPLRDFVYNTIANNRYRIFGRRETCRLPTPEEKERFLP